MATMRVREGKGSPYHEYWSVNMDTNIHTSGVQITTQGVFGYGMMYFLLRSTDVHVCDYVITCFALR